MTDAEQKRMQRAHEVQRMWLENHKRTLLVQSRMLDDAGLYGESHTLMLQASEVDVLLKQTKL